MTSSEARRDPVGPPSVRSQRDLVAVSVERLESALYRLQTGGSTESATLDAVVSIAASLLRLQGTPARGRDVELVALEQRVARVEKDLARTPDGRSIRGRLDVVERGAIAARNALKELFARTDRLDEQVDQSTAVPRPVRPGRHEPRTTP